MLNLGIGLGLSGGAGGAGVVLGASEFYAPLTHSLVLTRGTGSATFTRATKAWEFGYAAAANSGADQVLIEVASGVARFGGARYDSGTWYNTYADGSAISASSLLGYHSEGARTNSLLWSRDLTNAAWVATNITASKTATGIDNAANAASTLTAGAADATILQTLSLAAAARSFSAYVKRRTGSGNIYITRDGGTNWTDITSEINSSTWTRVKIENTSVLNPSVGFKIATSGDAIDVDVCQDEAGAFISSPIVTTTAAVTRNADILYYAVAGNLTDAAGAAVATWKLVEGARATYVASRTIFSTTTALLYGREPKTTSSYDGTSLINSGASTLDLSAQKKSALSWGAGRSVTHDAQTPQTGLFDGAWGGASLYIGSSPGGSDASFAYIKDAYIWQSALTDAQLQQVTA